MAVKKGDTYITEVAVVKLHKGTPSVIVVDGRKYILAPNMK